MADLGTIGILVDVRGQPVVRELAKDLNNVATASNKVSPAAQKVINDLRRMRDAQKQVAQANTLAAASFSKLHLANVAKNLDNLTSSTLRYNVAAQQSMRGTNRFGMAAQQVGYQVGDFFVQVQSGTNALTAFGQQATQLAGLLPGVAGAIVGIGISLGTALGMAALRSQELTINFQQVGKDLAKSLQPIQGLIDAIGNGLSYAGQVAVASLRVLVENLDRIIIYGTTAATLFAGRYAAGLLAAAAATMKLSTALKFLREAMIRTGIGAVVVGVGELVYQFTRLSEGAGGVGNAVNLLWDVVKEFGSKVVALFNSLQSTFEAAARKLQSVFLWSLAKVISAFGDMTWAVSNGLNNLFGTNFQGADVSGISADLGLLALEANDASVAASNAADSFYEMATSSFESVKTLNEAIKTTNEEGVDFSKWLTKAEEDAKKTKKATEELRKELESPLVSAVGAVSDAFGDFIARGLSDFKGFVKQILGSFQSMIAQMIAMAVRNRIMLSLGIGGITPAAAAAGQVAGLGSATTMLGSLGTGTGLAGIAGGTGFLGGMGNAVAGLGGGGAGFFSVGANAAAAGVGGAATFASTIGAAIPVIGAVALAFGFLRKKTKELDNGLRITVTNMDALVKTFTTTETKRFFGLSKKVSTSVSEASSEISDPIVKAVQDIQGQIIKAAGAFGFAEDTFKDFLYNFEVSLKGLSEDQKIQKVNEELAKMGDSFAALTGHFSTMNELLEAANQRMELQNRLDTLLGNNQAVLQRQREAEIAATHELNRPLLTAIHTLEDAQSAVTSAFAALRASIDKTVEDLQKKLTVANEAVARSRGIFQQLESALSGRYLRGSDSQFSMRRQGALGFLRRGDFSDERQLEEALGVVAEPSEDLFKSFEDYARDFYFTSGIIEDAKKIAEVQLTADEKQVALLEKQIEDAQSQYDLMMQQYNELMGVNTNLLSVEEAVMGVQEAIKALAEAIKAAQMAAAIKAARPVAGVVGGDNAGGASDFKVERGTVGEQFKGGVGLQIESINQLYAAAQKANVSMSGKTAEQIRQEVSSKLQTGVLLSGVAGYQRFAAGGMHSGGLRIVGERGPELEATGPARIFNNRQTAEMFRDPNLTAVVVDLKEEVARMRSEQLQIQLEISKNTKRTYDIERKWDAEGLPATRT